MTRDQIKANRDSLYESMVAQLPTPGPDTMQRAIDMEFFTLLVMAHGAACKQLDSLHAHDCSSCNATELLGIASRIEKALPLTDTWANTIRAELGRLRKMAFFNGLNGKHNGSA